MQVLSTPSSVNTSAQRMNLLEEGRDALLGVDVEDGLGEEGGDAELRELLVGRPLRR